MTDPKLNELPVDEEGDFANRPESTLTEEEKVRRTKLARAATGAQESIGADAMLSDGSRGVDVSGVRTGAGAGAGSTGLTPSTSDSAATTEIVGGPRGTGMNYRDDTDDKDDV